MQQTIFDTPIINTIFYWASQSYMFVFRWKREGVAPDFPKYVMIAAPHTSNWDLVITLVIAFSFRLKVFWIGKHTIFKPPFGAICRWLGGVPVDRRRSGDTVAQIVSVFNKQEKLVMIIPPEGTRRKVHYWKTGFYYIAHGARVPIVLGYIDYKRKAGGIGPAITPSGNIDADMDIIKRFYQGIVGKHDDRWNDEGIGIK